MDIAEHFHLKSGGKKRQSDCQRSLGRADKSF